MEVLFLVTMIIIVCALIAMGVDFDELDLFD